jgi:hypothetical protein
VRVIVYAGPCYGSVHEVTATQGRSLRVQPPDLSAPFWVSICDVEEVK